MAVRSCAENRVDGRLSEYMAMCVCTVPDQVGGPQCSTDVVAEMPIESAPSGSSAETRVDEDSVTPNGAGETGNPLLPGRHALPPHGLEGGAGFLTESEGCLRLILRDCLQGTDTPQR